MKRSYLNQNNDNKDKDETLVFRNKNQFFFNNQIEVYADTQYRPSLPSDIDIFSNIDYEKINTKNRDMRERILSFLGCFVEEVLQISNTRKYTSTYRKLISSFLDDGSVVISWNYPTFRIYFSFEENDEESSYGIIEESVINGIISSTTGFLRKGEYCPVIQKVMGYVVGRA